MTDGKIQIWEGKILVDSGKVAVAEACCCGECHCCLDDELLSIPQNNATVTRTGVCDDDYLPCRVEGDYGFNYCGDYSADGWCLWDWSSLVNGTNRVLRVTHVIASNTWSAALSVGGTTLYSGDVTGHVSCDKSTGLLSADFTIDGVEETRCCGCQARVVI